MGINRVEKARILLAKAESIKKRILYGTFILENFETGYFFSDLSDYTKGELIDVNSSDKENTFRYVEEDENGNKTYGWTKYFIPEKYISPTDIFGEIAKKNKVSDKVSEPHKTTSNKEGNKMANTNDMINSMMMMKMLDGKNDLDIGKIMLMQSFSKGEPIKITDVVKSKIISTLKLDGDDLPLEKVMLLQMLDDNQLDLNQLIAFKMLGSMFDEKK